MSGLQVVVVANISFKLLQRLGNAETVGPILMGLAKPVHLLQPQSEDTDIVNVTAIAVVESILGRRGPLGSRVGGAGPDDA